MWILDHRRLCKPKKAWFGDFSWCQEATSLTAVGTSMVLNGRDFFGASSAIDGKRFSKPWEKLWAKLWTTERDEQCLLTAAVSSAVCFHSYNQATKHRQAELKSPWTFQGVLPDGLPLRWCTQFDIGRISMDLSSTLRRSWTELFLMVQLRQQALQTRTNTQTAF